MSRKLNFGGIVLKHIATLRDNRTGSLSFVDALVFLFVPLAIAISIAFLGNVLSNELLSLAVNFGAITTALLMSVLVLVYDQESKLLSSSDDPSVKANKKIKLSLLRQLYQNICFAIVTSLCVVVASFLEMFLKGLGVGGYMEYVLLFFAAVVVFLFINVVLTMLMIVKRFHALLTSGY
ncbi:hypothetical protein SAMN05661010_00056 [Modicisalibacter muralis]|uniref:DUF2721 domain-containing protein n=1 Tax=Modicisalibacter muralis TaxID=119000 RepID=A0A1G9EPP3_9GAMM|nr:hypothetical protein [Halomonas muralis]SDK78011.1 hypothetical protein SAMN05661010_00056 [Halomonas muralis]